MVKIISVVGARPQFIKLAPVCQAILKLRRRLRHKIIHTGQHYDYNMSKVFFRELGIPKPDYHLNVGSGPHGEQTGKMLERIEKVLLKEKPDWVIVYGDTNSTLAGALAAAKLHIPVAHVEAGLRSFNRRMPEEINRIAADHVSDVLFCPTETAVKNLKSEGFTNFSRSSQPLLAKLKKGPVVVNVGDVMYDALKISLKIAQKKSRVLKQLSLSPKQYYLATLHRAENTESRENLSQIFAALREISAHAPVIVPIHPRTRKQIKEFHINAVAKNLRILDPIGYFDMLWLEKNARAILTDSGGVQKEAYWLRVPCVTLREETEWVETLKSGWNILIKANTALIVKKTLTFRAPKRHIGRQKVWPLIAPTCLKFLLHPDKQ